MHVAIYALLLRRSQARVQHKRELHICVRGMCVYVYTLQC